MILTFPTLFKKTSTGAIQEWTISVKDTAEGFGEIVTVHGQTDGKLQTTSDTVREGKSLGKSNETTPLEQAEAEAKGKWESKLKSGYTKSIEDAAAGITDALITGGVIPMLAKKYSEDHKKIKYPALVQRKLDGIRCVAVLDKGVCTLWSRTRKPITGIPHIAREIERLYPGQTRKLDGEAYNHAYKHNFEQILSFVRQEDPKDGHEVVEYHVYDTINGETNVERDGWLKAFLPTDSATIKAVETFTVQNEDELMELYEQFLVEGYEGAMIRNMHGLYVNKRSADLQKVKPCDDAEFEVVGIAEGRGKLQGHVGAFNCVMEDGKPFEAKMRGSTAKLKEYYDDHGLWKGKYLTVKYNGFTAKGIPRFPVGVRFCDPSEKVEPKESVFPDPRFDGDSK